MLLSRDEEIVSFEVAEDLGHGGSEVTDVNSAGFLELDGLCELMSCRVRLLMRIGVGG